MAGGKVSLALDMRFVRLEELEVSGCSQVEGSLGWIEIEVSAPDFQSWHSLDSWVYLGNVSTFHLSLSQYLGHVSLDLNLLSFH